MCINAGKTDRIIRVMIGLVLITYGLISDNMIVAVIGLVPVLTAVIGFCPPYKLFKINTGCNKS